MSILYPLNINGNIPAFYAEQGYFSVPFSINRATNISDIKQIFATVKTISNSSFIINNLQGNINNKTVLEEKDFDLQDTINFNLTEEFLNKIFPGQSYKIQIYYKNEEGLSSYLSNVGVVKYTNKPELSLGNVEENNLLLSEIIGFYANEDVNEKVYNYQFDLFNNELLLESSGLLLHNINNIDKNNNDLSYDKYKFKTKLQPNQLYKIKYTIITNNGLQVEKLSDDLESNEKIPSDLYKCKIIANSNFDNGNIEIKIIPPSGESGLGVQGKFILYRSCEDDNYTQWLPLYYFHTNNLGYFPINITLYKDYTVEFGKKYKYAIQQYDENKYSMYLESNIISPNFEDMFLYGYDNIDKQYKQLNIRFNPKVSSFKNTVLEQKIDTIGSKYPFIFRNGNINYKEFPISGLISYQEDKEQYFNNNNYIEFNLTKENIKKEKDFKLNILNWLTNGEVKLFRSPTEGNYLVRLLNTSLSPNDTLGRMLHSFSSTAYEVDECSYDNYLKYNIVASNDKKTSYNYDGILNITKKLNLFSMNNNSILITSELHSKLIGELKIKNAQPGAQFILQDNSDNEEIITINSSGNYNCLLENIKNIYMQTFSKTGDITYSYMQSYPLISKFENIIGNTTIYKTGEITYVGWVGEHISEQHGSDNYFIQFKKAVIGIDDDFIFEEGYRNSNNIFYKDVALKNKIIFEANKKYIIKDLNTNLFYLHPQFDGISFYNELLPNGLAYETNNKIISINNKDTRITEVNVNDIKLNYGLKIYEYEVQLEEIQYKKEDIE